MRFIRWVMALAIPFACVLGTPKANGAYGEAKIESFYAVEKVDGSPVFNPALRPGHEVSLLASTKTCGAYQCLGDYSYKLEITFDSAVAEVGQFTENVPGLQVGAGAVSSQAFVPDTYGFGWQRATLNVPLKIRPLDQLGGIREFHAHCHSELTNPANEKSTGDMDFELPIFESNLDVGVLASAEGGAARPGEEVGWTVFATTGADTSRATLQVKLPDERYATLVDGSPGPDAPVVSHGKLTWTLTDLKGTDLVLKNFRVKMADPLPDDLQTIAATGLLKVAHKSKSHTGSIPVPHPHPDLLVSSGGGFVGAGIVSPTGKKEIAQRDDVASGATASHVIVIRNDGFEAHDFDVGGDPSLTKKGATTFDVKYFDAESGGADVTAAVTAGTWSTGVLAHAEERRIRVEVTPAVSKTTATISVAVRLPGVGKPVDLVKMRVRAVAN